MAEISVAVGVENPEEIHLPELGRYNPLVTEVQAIFQSMQGFLQRFQLYRNQLVESTRFETVARTVQIIAHDLKAPMASFERLTRIPDHLFAQEKKHLLQALQQLYSMTEAIKRAEFEDVVRLKTDMFDWSMIERNCQSIAEKSGRILEFAGSRIIHELQIDQSKLNRALSNLIINALEAARTKVRVSVENKEDEVLITIEDDGPGIDAEFLKRLFVRGATQGKTLGTGLGLYYARRVFQGHGGDVVYSRNSECTYFTVSLPKPLSGYADGISPHPDPVPAENSPTAESKDFLLVVIDPEKLKSLTASNSFQGVDIFLPSQQEYFVNVSYRFLLCEDWDLARQLNARQQKILIDPSEPMSRISLIVDRLKKTV